MIKGMSRADALRGCEDEHAFYNSKQDVLKRQRWFLNALVELEEHCDNDKSREEQSACNLLIKSLREDLDDLIATEWSSK